MSRITELNEELIKTLRLRSVPVAMKFFDDEKEMEAVPKIKVPTDGSIHTACQLIGQAVRYNYTVGFTAACLPSYQCMGTCSLCERELFAGSDHFAGVWYDTSENSVAHQQAMTYSDHVYKAVAVSPVSSGRLEDAQVILIYLTPQQAMYICNAYQYVGYPPVRCGFVGESSCSDSWTAALVHKELCVTIPCYAERCFGGVLDEEMAVAFPPSCLEKIVEGLRQLAKNGMRYPIAGYGLRHDVRQALGSNYDTTVLLAERGV